MKKCFTCEKEKEFINFSKDKRKHDGHCYECKDCQKVRHKKFYKRETKKQYYNKNKDRLKEVRKIYYNKNKEKFVVYAKLRAKNKKEELSEYYKKYKKENRHHYNALNAKREFRKFQQTPHWLTKAHLEEIDAIYELARKLSKAENIEYQVDHIIPLQGKEVRGLHVPWNLQILKKIDNISKGNRIN